MFPLPSLWLAVAGALVAFAAGALVNGWRLDSHHAAEMAAEKQRYETLASATREQNRAIEAAHAASETARRVADEARKAARARRTVIETRVRTVTAYEPRDCDDAVHHWWEAR
jgi:hypothetical protein